MDWNRRYLQQAAWTRQLRTYLFEKARLLNARRVLEVGCGTGAVMRDALPPTTWLSPGQRERKPVLFGIDIDLDALDQCRINAPSTLIACADALALPFQSSMFDLVFCHYLLLWVRQPLAALEEMKRTTVRGGQILALAEPNYADRIDEPAELGPAGRLQTRSLELQGADVAIGSRLGDLFRRAGIGILETGLIQPTTADMYSDEAARAELSVLQADLQGLLGPDEIARIQQLDADARKRGARRTYVPTYFAWGQV